MAATPQGLAQAEHLKILVIEDNPDDRELYRRLLAKKTGFDFEVFEAGDVKSGLELSGTNHPDCVLLDFNLPDASGLDFISRYRALGEGAENTAIVMVTGQGSEETAAAAMKLGALDYITKTSIMEGFFIQNILNAIERARLREQLADYQRRLEKKNEGLAEFAYSAAHDLKAPLRRITSYCQMLQEDCAEKLDDGGRNCIERMTVNIVRLQKLIDDLLIYSTASSAKETVEQVDLGKTMAYVLEDLDELIRANGAIVAFGDLPVLRACPTRVKQLFQNLIANAIKYRSEKNPVVTVEWEDLGTHLHFSFRDNGTGVPQQFREKIFKPFERLHTQDQVEGSGLGLAICRKVARMHHGKIWVEDAAGGGSVFHFTLAKDL